MEAVFNGNLVGRCVPPNKPLQSTELPLANVPFIYGTFMASRCRNVFRLCTDE